jgi:hypothetical protein
MTLLKHPKKIINIPISHKSSIYSIKSLSIGADMGSLGVGVMNSMAFSLSANSNPKVDENQISSETIDF